MTRPWYLARSAAAALLAVLALGGSLDLHALQAGEERHALAETGLELAQVPCEHARELHVEDAARAPVRECPACLHSLQARGLAPEADPRPTELLALGAAPPAAAAELASLGAPDTSGCRGPPVLS
jgi:hypothetical protein